MDNSLENVLAKLLDNLWINLLDDFWIKLWKMFWQTCWTTSGKLFGRLLDKLVGRFLDNTLENVLPNCLDNFWITLWKMFWQTGGGPAEHLEISYLNSEDTRDEGLAKRKDEKRRRPFPPNRFSTRFILLRGETQGWEVRLKSVS